MIGNFVPSNIPISYIGIVGVSERREESHLDGAAIGVLPLGEELVDGVDSVRLDGVVAREARAEISTARRSDIK